MALCPEDNQLAVLAPATLPERKQVAEAGILASERPSDLSNGVQNRQFTTNLQKEGKAKSRSISKALQPLPG